MNHADRRRLVEQLLLARTAADVQDAREMARAWLAQHPGDSGIRSATEWLGMVEEALRRLGLWDVPPQSRCPSCETDCGEPAGQDPTGDP